MMVAMVTPAGANKDGGPACCDGGGGRMATQDVGADCEQAAMDTPNRPGDLKVTTDVPDGATVAPGQDIGIKLTWDPKAWSGRDLDAALACVAVKGGLDPDLSNGERPTANDGVYEYVLHVPDNIRPGCDICVQGFLTGMGGDGDPQQVTGDRACFMSGPPRPTPPATRPPAPPAPTPPATTAPRTPAEVGGITASQPAPAPLAPAPSTPAVAPAGELPRTGSPVTDLAAASGGLSLMLGGLSVIGAAGRRNRRRRG
jgi:hypothetical protein